MSSPYTVTINLSPRLAKVTEQFVRKQQVSRAEFFNEALRHYIEECAAVEAIGAYNKERRAGQLKELKGSLADLMR